MAMNNQEIESKAKDFLKSFLPSTEEKVTDVPEKPVDQYRDLPISQLPLGKLYHPNLRVQFRALDVGEITNYSTLESNDSDLVRPKLDEILNKTLKVSLQRQKLSYKHLFVHDRVYLIYTIREFTFQSGRILVIPVTCTNPSCKHNFEIELIRQNMEMHGMDEEVWEYYNPEYGCFVFETTIQDDPYCLRPPTIGLQESFMAWIQDQKYKNKPMDASFVKIAPYTINAVELSVEELSQLQDEFINGLKMKPKGEEEFQFLNDVVDRFRNNTFKMGLKGMMKQCPLCGTEVRTNTVFPKRARDLFIVPNAFRHFIKK
jgi:hypothetical protein